MNTNIIDSPRIAGGADLLGVDKYMQALIHFIQSAQMPTTIAIQGEWGSGKTSMMNQIKHQLCEGEDGNTDKPFYGIWLNTWQYALMKEPDEVLVSIMSGITKDIMRIITQKHQNKTKDAAKKAFSILGKIAKAAAKTAVSTVGMDAEVVDDILSNEDADANILDLKAALQDAINKCLEADQSSQHPKKGFLFFIDDLDRIDPPVAVQTLELIKNIFEVEHCIFVLAIDYDVVVKGLEPKFGPLTVKNEREFRSFFDKIIQLPFSMPVASYQIDQLLIDSLKKVRYVDDKLAKDEEFQTLITEMATQSVGTNPRAIKRLINTLSLIQIINDLDDNELGKSRQDKLINFGLVCIQIAYPNLYHLIMQEPNYVEWDDKVANKLQLKKLTADQIERLDDTDEFDEDWEKVVFRVCMGDPFLNRNIYNVSNLLNTIRDLITDEQDFAAVMESVLSLSAVTDVSAEQVKPQNKKTTKDYSKYVFQGKKYGKGRLVHAIVKHYVEHQSKITYAGLKEIFPDDIQGSHAVFTTLESAVAIYEEKNRKRHFIKEKEVIQLEDEKIAVCTQWVPKNIERFVDKARALGYEIGRA